MPQSREGGIQPQRLEFVRESIVGEAPADPSWNLYSDNARTFEPSLSPQTTAQDGLGNPDSTGSFAGTEQHEVTVVYDLQQWLIDGSGNAQDASYDGIGRDSDNRLPNSHTVVRRMDISNLDAANTISGNTSYDTREYFVGKGGTIDEANVSGVAAQDGTVLAESTGTGFDACWSMDGDGLNYYPQAGDVINCWVCIDGANTLSDVNIGVKWATDATNDNGYRTLFVGDGTLYLQEQPSGSWATLASGTVYSGYSLGEWVDIQVDWPSDPSTDPIVVRLFDSSGTEQGYIQSTHSSPHTSQSVGLVYNGNSDSAYQGYWDYYRQTGAY